MQLHPGIYRVKIVNCVGVILNKNELLTRKGKYNWNYEHCSCKTFCQKSNLELILFTLYIAKNHFKNNSKLKGSIVFWSYL